MANKKAVICIHVFPALDYIEIVQLDSKQGNIDKAASLPGAFEPVTRQIADTEQLAQVLKDLYEGNRISLNTPAVLVLPSFFTKEADVPVEFSDEERRMTLLSEVERFYIFKKNEPHLDWVNMTGTRVLYSAFPKLEMERYFQIFQDNKIPLVAIELNYFALLRGLAASGALADELSQNQTWGLLVVSDYNFFGAIVQGSTFVQTVESPISGGANEELAAINEIQQDFDEFLLSTSLTKLVLVNNSERLDSEMLTNRLSYQDQVLVIEQNQRTLRSRGEMNAPYPCSLEAIGGCLYPKYDDLPKANLVPEVALEQAALAETKGKLTKILGITCVLVIVLCLGIWGLFSFLIMLKENDIKTITEQTAQLSSGQSTDEVKEKRFIKKEMDYNRLTNNFVVKVGSAIPDELWVDEVTVELASDTRAQRFHLSGGAMAPDRVDSYLNELKKGANINILEIGKVTLTNNTDGQSFYTWSIETQGVDLTKKNPT
jgi:hypothetical protein